jgi:CrcB protein
VKLLINYLAGGGALGAVARYIITLACARFIGLGFPYGTFVINISGSFVLGYVAAAFAHRERISHPMYLAVAVGFIGAYTTFSTWTYDSEALMRNSEWLKAAANLLGSIVVGLIAVRMGVWAGAMSETRINGE